MSKTTTLSLTFCLTLSFTSISSHAQSGSDGVCPELEPFRATYHSEVHKWITLKGDGVQELIQLDDTTWEFRFDVESMVADMHESVRFQWDDQSCQVIPLKYQSAIEGKLIKDRKTYFTNDRDDNRVSGEYRGKDFQTDSKDLYVDPLGLQIQVRQDLKSGKTTMKYHMIHKGKILIDRYRVVGHELVRIGNKEYEAVKLEKVRPDTSDRETYMWMAPDLNYALIRLLHKEPDGESYTVNAKDINIL